MRIFFGLKRWALCALLALLVPCTLRAQTAVADDPITAAQLQAARRAAGPAAGAAEAAGAVADAILAAQVRAAAEKTFPNLAADLENAELFRKVATDPTLRGNLRGRIAESDWINRNAKDGWKPVTKANAPQNDAYRRVNGRLEGAQVKVHADWQDYIRSMQKDNKAEKFVLPDDHYEPVYKNLEMRRAGALRGGLVEKAAEYKRQQDRLTKMGRTFTEVDGAVTTAAKHYGRIAKAIRSAGKAASFIAIAVSVVDGSIAVYETAIGQMPVEDLVKRLGGIVVTGGASWAVASVAGKAAVAAGATGAVPVAVAIVIGTATYLVVDWAIGEAVDAMRVGHLTAEDIKRVLPNGARGVPLDRLYLKPVDPAVLLE